MNNYFKFKQLVNIVKTKIDQQQKSINKNDEMEEQMSEIYHNPENEKVRLVQRQPVEENKSSGFMDYIKSMAETVLGKKKEINNNNLEFIKNSERNKFRQKQRFNQT